MKYEYKIIELAPYDESLTIDDFDKLQKWFDEGWEYVDSIIQPIASGTSSTWKSAVGVVIRKEKTNPLD